MSRQTVYVATVLVGGVTEVRAGAWTLHEDATRAAVAAASRHALKRAAPSRDALGDAAFRLRPSLAWITQPASWFDQRVTASVHDCQVGSLDTQFQRGLVVLARVEEHVLDGQAS